MRSRYSSTGTSGASSSGSTPRCVTADPPLAPRADLLLPHGRPALHLVRDVPARVERLVAVRRRARDDERDLPDRARADRVLDGDSRAAPTSRPPRPRSPRSPPPPSRRTRSTRARHGTGVARVPHGADEHRRPAGAGRTRPRAGRGDRRRRRQRDVDRRSPPDIGGSSAISSPSPSGCAVRRRPPGSPRSRTASRIEPRIRIALAHRGHDLAGRRRRSADRTRRCFVADVRQAPEHQHAAPSRASGPDVRSRRRGARARAGAPDRIASRLSTAPRGLPGRLIDERRSGRCRATPRDRSANGVDARPAARIASASPGASRSITARVASGVTSRTAKPVPPVVTIRATSRCVLAQSALDLRTLVGDDARRHLEPGAVRAAPTPQVRTRRRVRRASTPSLTVTTTAVACAMLAMIGDAVVPRDATCRGALR